MTIALVFGALFAMLAVILGAFGAHALKDKFKEEKYAETWETAVRYQMYHAFGFFIIGILSQGALFGENGAFNWAFYLMLAGVVIFSGSLYVLSLTGIKKLGAITPIGGLLMIAAWICVLCAL